MLARNVGDVGNVAVTLLLADLFRHAIRVPTVRKNRLPQISSTMWPPRDGETRHLPATHARAPASHTPLTHTPLTHTRVPSDHRAESSLLRAHSNATTEAELCFVPTRDPVHTHATFAVA